MQSLPYVICVDLEDYFQCHYTGIRPAEWPQYELRIETNTARLLELLESHKTRATFFALGWIADKAPQVIRSIVAAGHEVEAHSYWHRRLTDLTAEEFREDLRRCAGAIGNITGCSVAGFRAPSWSLTAETPWALDILQQEGFLYDSSIIPCRGLKHVKGMPGALSTPHKTKSGMVEFPVPVYRIGNFRYPYPLATVFRLTPCPVLRWMIAAFKRRNNSPVMISVHPADFDKSQPRLPLSLSNRAMKYGGITGAASKLIRILDEFQFVPMRTALAQLGLLNNEIR
jgi:polysaccharide deacetylase family protein (PEP-CTERM system associated)